MKLTIDKRPLAGYTWFYNIACAYSLAHDAGKAIASLQKAYSMSIAMKAIQTPKDSLYSGMLRSFVSEYLSKICLLFLISFCHSAFGQKDKGNHPLISVSEIKTCKSDTFRIKAKVIDVYQCPPCPKGAQCKPCIGNHIVVTDIRNSAKEQLFVFTENPESLAKGSSYTFVLKLRNKTHPEPGAELLSFSPLGIK